MDNEDRKSKKIIIIPRPAYNQLIKLSHDKEFLDLLETKRAELNNLLNKTPTVKFMAGCKQEIRKFLHNKMLPTSWLEPIYNILVGKYQLDFPLDNSIALRVGSQEITGNTDEILLIRNNNTGELVGEELSLSIVITSKVKVDKIIQFITKHKKEIGHWQKVIGLPNYKKPNWKDVNSALKIIRMKDEEGKTFTQIAEILQQEANQENPDIDYTFDENTLKTTYNRYKKYLSSK